MINNVTLVGRLTRDPELRNTSTGTAVATFSLAVNRRFKNAAGERVADFINCVIWRQGAENIAAWAKKGALLGVVGSIQTRNYENQQGQRVYVTEVVADYFQMLESRAVREQATSANYSAPAAPVSPAPNFGRDNATSDPFGNSSPMEISDDDLPF